MMTYLRPSNRGNTSRRTKIIYAILLFVIIFSFLFSKLAFIIGGPMWSVQQSIVGTVNSVASYFKSKSSLWEENENLKKILEQKEGEIIVEKNKVELYKQLDSYVALKDIAQNETVVRVVSRPPQTPFDVLVVEIKDASIKSGQKVFYAGIPVGVVDSISGSYGKIFLFSNPASQFRVLIGENKIEGDAKGKSQGNIYLTLPQSVEVKVGDTVFLSEGTLPIGTISKIDDGSSQSFVDIYVKMPFSPSRVDWLTIKKE